MTFSSNLTFSHLSLLFCFLIVPFTEPCDRSTDELAPRHGCRHPAGAGGTFWGSNSRIGLEDSPRCAPPRASVPTLCLSSILRRWRDQIYQQIQLHAENSEVPAEKEGLNGLFSPPPLDPRTHLHPSALHSPHFPFTLLRSPGENSPSCQCNVAHRGNHAASLASGAGENATLALNHRRAPVYGKVFGTLWKRGSLAVGILLLLELLLLPHAGASALPCFSRVPIGGGADGSPLLPYGNSAHAEKEPSWTRGDPLKHSGFMSPISSQQSEAHRCDRCHGAEVGCRTHPTTQRLYIYIYVLYIEMRLHSGDTLGQRLTPVPRTHTGRSRFCVTASGGA